jgi:hypothetical protein
MTARINTTVHNVGITFDGKEGIAHRADIVETSLPGATERTCELILSGLPEDIRREAMDALDAGRQVDVRVLGFYGPWTVAETAMEGDAAAFRLKSAGYIMSSMGLGRHTVEG